MNSDYRFFISFQNGNAKTTKEFTGFTTDYVLENLEHFLRGCGFKINGKLDIVEEDSLDVNDGIPFGWTVDQLSGLRTEVMDYSDSYERELANCSIDLTTER